MISADSYMFVFHVYMYVYKVYVNWERDIEREIWARQRESEREKSLRNSYNQGNLTILKSAGQSGKPLPMRTDGEIEVELAEKMLRLGKQK